MYRDIVLADRPSLLWPLDEASGTAVRDLSPYGRSGSYIGSPTLAGGVARPSARAPLFAGNKYVQASASFQLAGSGKPLALEVWFVKLTHLAGYPGNINSVFGDLASVANGALFRFDDATTLRAYIASGSGYYTVTASGWQLRRLTHAVVTAEPNKRAQLILNGRVVDDISVTSVAGWNLAPRVARSEDGRYFNGFAGWAAAYDSAPFTIAQARRHYEAGLNDIVPRLRQRLR